MHPPTDGSAFGPDLNKIYCTFTVNGNVGYGGYIVKQISIYHFVVSYYEQPADNFVVRMTGNWPPNDGEMTIIAYPYSADQQNYGGDGQEYVSRFISGGWIKTSAGNFYKWTMDYSTPQPGYAALNIND